MGQLQILYSDPQPKTVNYCKQKYLKIDIENRTIEGCLNVKNALHSTVLDCCTKNTAHYC